MPSHHANPPPVPPRSPTGAICTAGTAAEPPSPGLVAAETFEENPPPAPAQSVQAAPFFDVLGPHAKTATTEDGDWLDPAKAPSKVPSALGTVAGIFSSTEGAIVFLQAAMHSLRGFQPPTAEQPLDKPSANQWFAANQHLQRAKAAVAEADIGAVSLVVQAMQALTQQRTSNVSVDALAAVDAIERAGTAANNVLVASVASDAHDYAAALRAHSALFDSYSTLQNLMGRSVGHPAQVWLRPASWHVQAKAHRKSPLPPVVAGLHAQRPALETAALQLLKTSDLQAAATLRDWCWARAAERQPRDWSQLWHTSAAVFDGVASGCLLLEVFLKRSVLRLLQECGVQDRGPVEGRLPEVNVDVMHEMLYFCAQAMPQEGTAALDSDPKAGAVLRWVQAAWGMETVQRAPQGNNELIYPFDAYSGKAAGPGEKVGAGIDNPPALPPWPLNETPPAPLPPYEAPPTLLEIAAPHALDAPAPGIQLIDGLPIHTADYHAFLFTANEASSTIQRELQAWHLEPGHPTPHDALALATALSERAAVLGLSELAELSQALAAVLQAAMQRVVVHAASRRAMLAAAEEIGHLLQEFEAGFLKPVPPQILHDLQDCWRL